jgi:hypothetical protein
VAIVVVLGAAGCLSKPEPPGGGGFDEDRDGVPNQADRCPHRAGPDANRDGDGDGIGDACDPEDGADNTRVFFEGFDAVACNDEHLVFCNAGTIDAANGWYTFASVARGVALFAGDHDRVAVTVGIDIFERNMQATWNEIGIMLCAAESTETFVQGVQSIVGTMGGTEYVEFYEMTDGENARPHGHQELTSLDLDMPVLDMELRCELRLPAATCALRVDALTTTFAATTIARGPGQIGVYGNNLGSRVRYVDVVSLVE